MLKTAVLVQAALAKGRRSFQFDFLDMAHLIPGERTHGLKCNFYQWTEIVRHALIVKFGHAFTEYNFQIDIVSLIFV